MSDRNGPDSLAEEIRQRSTFNPVGILLAALFFGASLTPSLMPREAFLLGALGGTVAAVGYEMGAFAHWLWRFMQLPEPPAARQRVIWLLSLLLALAIALYCLSNVSDWQNAARAVAGLEPVPSAFPKTVAAIALGMFLALWFLFRLFSFVLRRVNRMLSRIVPVRIGRVIGFALVVWGFWALLDGLLLRAAFRAADASFEAADDLIEPDTPRPDDPMKTGSSASLVEWEEMGRWGRSFVAHAPTRAEIAEFDPAATREPIRVYVGRLAADTPRERAELALRELIRVGGFERSALVVAVPVGTGWMDPGAHDTLDFMLGGDVATVAVQYSYLTSVMALMAHPQFGVEQSRELFDVIYGYWTRLPKDHRPKLYVHGLSQGAYNSQVTLPLLDMLGDPIQGALWAGSPFFSPYWQMVRDRRQKDSPAWRPRFGNGSLARVMNQGGSVESLSTPWGPTRLVFLNYGSDPIVVFTSDVGVHPPAWLRDPRAPDVSPALRWFPFVTMFQLAMDMAISLDIPRHGHHYIAPDYIDAWAAVVEPDGWTPERAARLKAIFKQRDPSF